MHYGNAYDYEDNVYPHAGRYPRPDETEWWPSLHLIVWIILLIVVIWLLWCPDIKPKKKADVTAVVNSQLDPIITANPSLAATLITARNTIISALN